MCYIHNNLRPSGCRGRGEDREFKECHLSGSSRRKPMNRSELVERLSRRNTRLDEEVLARYVDVVFGEIADALAEGRRVEIRGFGSFWAKDRAERMSRNPRTGEAVHVPAKRVPAFRAGRLLRQRLVDSPGGGAEAGGEGEGDGAAPEDKKD